MRMPQYEGFLSWLSQFLHIGSSLTLFLQLINVVYFLTPSKSTNHTSLLFGATMLHWHEFVTSEKNKVENIVEMFQFPL